MSGKTLSKSLSVADADLRRALRRSRRQKATIKSLSRENARLRKGAKTSRNRIETLEVQLERLRATGAVLSRALYGRKSEQQDKPGSEHKRGQQRGAPGHGRTQRPGLDERTEEHNPPPDACVCGRCGQPYAPNGAEESTLVEIEVKAYKRVIRRPRWRRTCECASSPMEVSAPPVPRLFPRTLYGTSFWARFLFEHCACFRPVHRVAAWMWQTDFTYLKVIGWGWFYLSTILDDYSRHIIAWKLCTNMTADDVTATLKLALEASGCNRANVVHKPRLLSDNGSSYISGDLAEWLEDHGMDHLRGAPYHPQTQGKIERWHQTLKNRILLENYYLPGDLENQISAFVDHYNNQRYHESIGNVTPADAYFGRHTAIIEKRKKIKKLTTQNRRLNHQSQAA